MDASVAGWADVRRSDRHPLGADPAPRDSQVSFSASGGPGGQHANKAATRVELRLDLEHVGRVRAGPAAAGDRAARRRGPGRRRRRAQPAPQPGARRGATRRPAAVGAARRATAAGDQADQGFAATASRCQAAARRGQAAAPAATVSRRLTSTPAQVVGVNRTGRCSGPKIADRRRLPEISPASSRSGRRCAMIVSASCCSARASAAPRQ